MANKLLPFKIFSELLTNHKNIYQIAKKLKIETSSVSYHCKKIEKLKIPGTITKKKLSEIGEKLLPIFQKEFGELNYNQVDFLLQYSFYYMLNEFK